MRTQLIGSCLLLVCLGAARAEQPRPEPLPSPREVRGSSTSREAELPKPRVASVPTLPGLAPNLPSTIRPWTQDDPGHVGPVESLAIPHAPAPKGSGPVVVPLTTPRGVIYLPTAFYQPNPYEVWQYYSTNQMGKILPRVIYRDGQAFYAADGRPFPYAFVTPGVWRP